MLLSLRRPPMGRRPDARDRLRNSRYCRPGLICKLPIMNKSRWRLPNWTVCAVIGYSKTQRVCHRRNAGRKPFLKMVLPLRCRAGFENWIRKIIKAKAAGLPKSSIVGSGILYNRQKRPVLPMLSLLTIRDAAGERPFFQKVLLTSLE
jgi:hypothetical protein